MPQVNLLAEIKLVGRLVHRLQPVVIELGFSLVGAQQVPCDQTFMMRIAEVKQRRGAQQRGIAFIIRVQASVTREQVEIARLQLQANRLEPAASYRKSDQLLAGGIMQHGLFDDVAQGVEADAPHTGKDDQIAAVLAFRRDLQRQ